MSHGYYQAGRPAQSLLWPYKRRERKTGRQKEKGEKKQRGRKHKGEKRKKSR